MPKWRGEGRYPRAHCPMCIAPLAARALHPRDPDRAPVCYQLRPSRSRALEGGSPYPAARQVREVTLTGACRTTRWCARGQRRAWGVWRERAGGTSAITVNMTVGLVIVCVRQRAPRLPAVSSMGTRLPWSVRLGLRWLCLFDHGVQRARTEMRRRYYRTRDGRHRQFSVSSEVEMKNA